MLKRYDGDQIVLLDDEFNIVGLNDPRTSKAKWAQLQVRSVQHTGTCFLHDLLRENGWYVRTTHFNPVNREGFLISPIRNPEEVWKTWCSQERREDFEQMWNLFNDTFLNNPDLHIVPVDTEDREDHLKKLGQRLKCNLKTNWKPVNTHVRKNFKERDLTSIYDLPVVRKFYG